MRIAIVTCDGFNEIDSFVSSYILNRVDAPGWRADVVVLSDMTQHDGQSRIRIVG